MGNFTVPHIYVAKAARGATTFCPPVLASVNDDINTALDKPWLAISQGGPILVSYTWQQGASAGIVVPRSGDARATRGRALGPHPQNDGLAYLGGPTGSPPT